MLIISGSSRAESYSAKLAEYMVSNYFETKNHDFIDLRNISLAPLGLEVEKNTSIINEIKQIIEKHDTVIFITPEYHGGMSGSLKNFLDHLSKKDFNQKVAGIISLSGGGKGGINALNSLRLTLRSLGIDVISEQIIFNESDVEDLLNDVCPLEASLEFLIEKLESMESVTI